MKLRILLLVIVLALVAGVVYRIQNQQAGDARKNGGDRALSVKTVPVAVRDFPRVIDLPGTLEAAQQVAIVAQAGGTVLRQHVQEGDAVRAGQVLFSLDARPAQARIAQSQATLTGARAETAEAEKKLERLKPLMQPGYISRQEFDDAQLVLEAARARAGTARAELETARLDAQYAQIRAPIAGRVGRIAVRAGSLVQAGGEPLTTLLAPGALDVRASVAQQDWPELAAARMQGKVTAEVFHNADRTVRARGELVFVDAQIDTTTGAVPIKVRLAGASPALLSGQGVRVRLLLGTEPNAKVVPEAALQHAQEGTYVYVVRDGKALVQPVKQTRSLDGEQVVEGELRAGEPVLIETPQRLKAGSKVRLEGARR
ncbi:MAG: efflux RND transporter periplasmic adaptor subunit [Rhodoferax sp.]|uniref:efflux RND transporter periplasmic adaptor subunit n=1 Tax=Rhodoferax sp. TaxID=50421 RepID=UPI00272F7664|nr:efflux RND transporter periplasmic adaptor subunit [Rhodoferax sp.]MDP1529257.1 efflux RND transporter periplasmic adaptor subunit [Rhodoferax sp.]MDP2057928.1 efflux RND transporter periplasmic adaptor subunit [Thiobacillus sp.]